MGGKLGKRAGKCVDGMLEGAGDILEGFSCLILGGKPKKLKKRVGKKARPAYSLSERLRGVVYLVVGATIVWAAFAAETGGIVGVRELASLLVNSVVGRVILLSIGLSTLVYGLWKIVMGAD